MFEIFYNIDKHLKKENSTIKYRFVDENEKIN